MRHPDPNFGYPSLTVTDSRWRARASGGSMPNNKAFKGLNFMRHGAHVLDSHIDAVTWDEAMSRIASWAAQRQSRFVAFCNVHSVVTASQEAGFQKVIAQADLALPDGAPVAWALRREGFSDQQRISGPDLMWRYLGVAEKLGQSVFFYGSRNETLDSLTVRVKAAFPRLKIVGLESPPFRELTAEEDQAYVDQINQSGAHVVFVSLGCPKQEAWIASHRGRINAVMLGVGAAFDYHAGTIQRAPSWMQKCGMEWLHRLASEPRRLAKRYAVTNSVFVFRMVKSMLLGSTLSQHEKMR